MVHHLIVRLPINILYESMSCILGEDEFRYELYQRIVKVTTDWIKEESIRDPRGLGQEAVDVLFSAYGTAMSRIAAKLAADVPELKSAVIATLDEQHKMAKRFVQRGGKL